MLGIELTDLDVRNVPLLGPTRTAISFPARTAMPSSSMAPDADGMPTNCSLEGTPRGPRHSGRPRSVRTGHAFLNDIAHHAAPGLSTTTQSGTRSPVADADAMPAMDRSATVRDGNTAYDNELLDAHFITGDGRGNENIGLTAVHTSSTPSTTAWSRPTRTTILAVGRSRLPQRMAADADCAAARHFRRRRQASTRCSLGWRAPVPGGRFTTEMQYQHLVFEEFARKMQPNVDAFVFTNSADIDPAIVAEFAHVVYRFGHSMLTETVIGSTTTLDSSTAMRERRSA